MEQRAQQDKPWQKKKSATAKASDDESADAKPSDDENADASGSAKRTRDDISATPQKASSDGSDDDVKIPSAGNAHDQGQKLAEDEDGEQEEPKVRTPSPLDQGPTPYWKAVEERGRGTSPKLTRSAAKKKKEQQQQQQKQAAVGFAEEAYRNGGGGGELLFFSPPDQVRNAERERKEIRAKEDNRYVLVYTCMHMTYIWCIGVLFVSAIKLCLFIVSSSPFPSPRPVDMYVCLRIPLT